MKLLASGCTFFSSKINCFTHTYHIKLINYFYCWNIEFFICFLFFCFHVDRQSVNVVEEKQTNTFFSDSQIVSMTRESLSNKIFEIKRTTRGRRDFLQFKRFLGNPVSFCLINCLTSYCACWIFSHSLDFSLNTQHSKIATFSAHALSSLSHYQYFSIFFQTLSVYRQCFHEKFSRMCEKKLFFRSWALR